MLAEVKDLTRNEYEFIRRLVYAKSGINLGNEKMQLVRARLGKRVRQSGFKSYRDYFNHVERDPTGEELCQLLDAISTNTTHLFREGRHFQFLRETIKRWVEDKAWRAKNASLRIWSAGCSSGEEPYSIAMTADATLQNHSNIELKILATDLSVQMLSTAKLGLYESHRVGTVPPEYKNHYLRKVEHEGQRMLQIVPELRRLIKFARFNLMTPTFPFQRGFHVIFCRNVMIYFDRPTQETLVSKFAAQLLHGGYLMIGHSESLNAIEHTLSYVEPTIYRKG
ncbi:MAG: protein-glutamate O-methyltransferase CheR [Phycisphaerae bacterium]